MRPLLHEIDNVYICGDGKKFLDEKEAETYQQKLASEEKKKMIRLSIKEKKAKIKRLEKELNIDKIK